MKTQTKYRKNMKPVFYKKEKNTSVHSLIDDLQSKDGLLRQSAREKLVSMGRGVVPYLEDLIKHPDTTLRWEAIKALGRIADPGSAPLLIYALYDKDEDVRWVAAEGLIAIGANAMKSLLDELIKNPESFFLRKGAHHYFAVLREYGEYPELIDLITALHGPDAKIHTPVAAVNMLKALHRIR